MVKGGKIKGSDDGDNDGRSLSLWFGSECREGKGREGWGRGEQHPTQVRLETDKTCLLIVVRHSFIHSFVH